MEKGFIKTVSQGRYRRVRLSWRAHLVEHPGICSCWPFPGGNSLAHLAHLYSGSTIAQGKQNRLKGWGLTLKELFRSEY